MPNIVVIDSILGHGCPTYELGNTKLEKCR